MATITYQGPIQLRNGTAAAWTSANPILLAGEMGVETDTNKFKIGDGVTAWNSLAYGGLQGPAVPLSSATPSPLGTASAGASTNASRSDHVHAMPTAAQVGAPAGSGTSTGANTGDVTLGAVGASPNANGASLAGQVLTLQPASASQPGLLRAAQFNQLANLAKGEANVLDFGADPTGAVSSETAITNAIASLPAGGVVYFPPGTYLTTSSPYIVSANQITLRGASPGSTLLKTNNTTGDQIRLTGYGCCIEDIAVQGPGTGTTSNKTAGIGVDVQSTEGHARNIEFAYQWEALSLSGTLVDCNDIVCRYFNRTGIIVNHNSDHRITTVLMNNNAATLPTNAGIDVRVTASLVLEELNIINSNFALNVSPSTGVTVPSVKATDCFFDTSVVGLNMQGAGSVFRSEFTNCWFSSQSVAGIRMDPAVGGSVDGITFVNCDIYQNIGGTTDGVIAGARVGKWKMMGCSLAGWTRAITLTAGAAHFPTIIGNTIGAISAFAVNGTGITVGAGAYKGLVIATNDVVDNTAAISLGAATFTVPANYRIIDNAGINPRGSVGAIAVPASTVVRTNDTGFRVKVYMRAGTITVITVNGVATGATATPSATGTLAFALEPGDTIQMTYSVAPTWVWIAS